MGPSPNRTTTTTATTAVAPPADLTAIAVRVQDRLVTLLDAESARWSRLDGDLAEPLELLGAMVLSGGKRLRPAFVHWGFVAAGGSPDDPRIVDAGAAFEMLHTFALIHDDVVDDSSTRRGRPALHVDFARHHATRGYRGEGRRFGEGVAVLVGDLAHVYADVLAAGFSAPALGIWNELRVELNIGQFLDLLGTAQGDTAAARAAIVARYKSAKYTIERPLHVGAALGGGIDELAPVLSAYGIPLGEAFQFRDDLLGVFGDASVTGKPVGDDLREGKPTTLLATAVERADDEQRAVLALVGSSGFDALDVERCQQILVDTGAAATIEAQIATRRDDAVEVIADAPIGQGARDALVDLAWYVTARDR